MCSALHFPHQEGLEYQEVRRSVDYKGTVSAVLGERNFFRTGEVDGLATHMTVAWVFHWTASHLVKDMPFKSRASLVVEDEPKWTKNPTRIISSSRDHSSHSR